MPYRSLAIAALTSLAITATVQAAPSVSVAVNPANTIPNVVANSLFADGDGADWTGLSVYVELDQGAVHNAAAFDGALAQESFWFLVPELEFDTYLGIPGDGTKGIAGGAGDLGGPEGGNQFGLLGADGTPQLISATVFNTDKLNTGPIQTGNISLSNDASGSWSMAVTFASSPKTVYLSNPVVDGELIIDPLAGDLGFDGFVGVEDLNTVLGAWNQSVAAGDRGAGDPSGDGFVGIEDLNTVLGGWNSGFGPMPSVTPGVVPYDFNGDGFVGIDDQDIVMTNWNLNVTEYSMGDANGDGFVGIEDMAYRNWNAGTPPSPSGGYTPPIAIPEPGALGVMILSGIGLLRRRR